MNATLFGKIIERQAVVGVVGLGYAGLPLAVEFGRAGYRVVGFDVDEERVAFLNDGVSYVADVPSEILRTLVDRERFRATADFTALADTDVAVICVPTPLRKTREPDISYVLAAAEQVAAHLHAQQLVILESTTYPGTTDEVLLPMLEATGLRLDADFFLAFSPERVDPGNRDFQTHNIPKVVGGVSAISTEMAAALYQSAVQRVHKVASARVAETAKLLENTFRSVNIALVNEMAQLCQRLGVDTWDVIEAAATKPFGFLPFYPGPGIGGHCLSGRETVRVRFRGERESEEVTLGELFLSPELALDAVRFTASGSEIVYRPGVEVLSIHMETQRTEWRPVHYIVRRRYTGDMVGIMLSGGRMLVTTDEHPMLVYDDGGSLKSVFARALNRGAVLPMAEVARAAAVGAGNAAESVSSRIVPVSVAAVSLEPAPPGMEVYSLEVAETHTFMTSHGIFVHNCIPLDPQYLSWKARMLGFHSRFIDLAEEVNSRMPAHVVQMVQDEINRDGKALRDANVLVLGVAYKRNVADVRESPALAILEGLHGRFARVRFHDPHVPSLRLDGGEPMESVPLTAEALDWADCVVIVTDHSQVDYGMVLDRAALVIDTRNVTRSRGSVTSRARVVRL